MKVKHGWSEELKRWRLKYPKRMLTQQAAAFKLDVSIHTYRDWEQELYEPNKYTQDALRAIMRRAKL